MHLRAHHKKKLRRISLTPLADLVFILLVFFILETSFTEYREMGFNVPEEKSEKEQSAELLRIELFADGKLWINGDALPLEQLDRFLESGAYSRKTAIVIAVHDKAPLQLLVRAMDQLQAHDLEKVRIASLKPTAGGSE